MQLEYLELLKGDLPPNKSDISEGINTTWSRVAGGEGIQVMVEDVVKNFDFKDPSQSVPYLVKIYSAIQNTQDPFWKEIKTKEVKKPNRRL